MGHVCSEGFRKSLALHYTALRCTVRVNSMHQNGAEQKNKNKNRTAKILRCTGLVESKLAERQGLKKIPGSWEQQSSDRGWLSESNSQLTAPYCAEHCRVYTVLYCTVHCTFRVHFHFTTDRQANAPGKKEGCSCNDEPRKPCGGGAGRNALAAPEPAPAAANAPLELELAADALPVPFGGYSEKRGTSTGGRTFVSTRLRAVGREMENLSPAVAAREGVRYIRVFPCSILFWAVLFDTEKRCSCLQEAW